MPRKQKKRTQKKPEIVYYEIELEDWEVECSFGLSFFPGEFGDGNFSEDSNIIFPGKILSPVLKNTKGAKVIIRGNPKAEDHWKIPLREKPPKGSGWIDLPRGNEILEFHAFYPSRALPIISTAASAGKIRHATIRGTKLRYRKGDIRNVDLLTSQKDYGDE